MILNLVFLYLFLTIGALLFAVAVYNSFQPFYVCANSKQRIYGSDAHTQKIHSYLSGGISCVFIPFLLIKMLDWYRYSHPDLGVFLSVIFWLLLLVLSIGNIAAFQIKNLLSKGNQSIRPLYCEKCKHPLRKLTSIFNFLNSKEQVASQIRSINFEIWHCQFCFSVINRESIHLRAYLYSDNTFYKCDMCNEVTMKLQSRQVITKPTTEKTGEELRIYKCHHCLKIDRNIVTLPAQPDIEIGF